MADEIDPLAAAMLATLKANNADGGDDADDDRLARQMASIEDDDWLVGPEDGTEKRCGGPGSGVPGPCAVAGGAAEKAQSLIARAKELPAKAWSAVKEKVAAAYSKLETKYGGKMATAIVAAGIIGTLAPLPGATLLATAPLIGAAELYNRLASRRDDFAELSEDEIQRLGKEWMAELLADWQENDLPGFDKE